MCISILCKLNLLRLCLLKLLFPLVDECVQDRLDVPHHIHNDSVFVTLGNEKDLADVSQSSHHFLFKLLCALRLSDIPAFVVFIYTRLG